ncbi:MAG: metal ABC transporter substrate-binding protein [Anaerovoracaceae bacterium]|jgi:zinc transport system substrate-binding protein
MKKQLYILVIIVLLAFLLAGCVPDDEASVVKSTTDDKVQDGKVQIVATLFPQYDFARQIAGDKAEVTLLLPPGMESHSYEPTPSDIIKINESDLFIYTGKNMEIWSQKIIDGMKSSNSKSLVLDLSEGIDLVSAEPTVAEHEKNKEARGVHNGGAGHDHDYETWDEHNNELWHDHNTGASHNHRHSQSHVFDPHIWTDPIYAKIMVNKINEALCRIDPVNEAYYKKNTARYNEELDALHEEFQAIVRDGHRNEIIFGSRFALYYFAKRYGLTYRSAFDSCSSETEPSARKVADLIDRIKEENIHVIYYAEMEDPKVARSISRETGKKMLLFHSCHNVTKEEFESGATYLSLMRQNAENLKEGLK